jgi:hypothetical protein
MGSCCQYASYLRFNIQHLCHRKLGVVRAYLFSKIYYANQYLGDGSSGLQQFLRSHKPSSIHPRIPPIPDPQKPPSSSQQKHELQRTLHGRQPRSLSIHPSIHNRLPPRPTRLFNTEPMVFLLTLMAAVAFGQIYLFTEALPIVYKQPPLNFTAKHASLVFVPLTIGMALDVFPRFYDEWLLKRIKVSGKVIKPEHKIRGFALRAPALAIGLWWFAWTIPLAVKTPWPVSFAPLILVGFATNKFDITLGGYLTDSYTIILRLGIRQLGIPPCSYLG